MGKRSKTVVTVAVLAVVVVASASGALFIAAKTLSEPPSRSTAAADEGPALNAAPLDEASSRDPYGRYAVVTTRDLFRPLVQTRERAGAVEGTEAGGGGSKGGASKSKEQSGPPPKPPGPTDDLAMTGVIDNGDEIFVLIENTKTGEGHFVREGETAFGLTVKKIWADKVVLEKGGKTYEVVMGSKQIGQPTEPKAPSPPPPSGDGQGRRGGGRRRTPWGEMSVEEMKKRLEQYKGMMTPEQYEKAKEGIEKLEAGGGQ